MMCFSDNSGRSVWLKPDAVDAIRHHGDNTDRSEVAVHGEWVVLTGTPEEIAATLFTDEPVEPSEVRIVGPVVIVDAKKAEDDA